MVNICIVFFHSQIMFPLHGKYLLLFQDSVEMSLPGVSSLMLPAGTEQFLLCALLKPFMQSLVRL